MATHPTSFYVEELRTALSEQGSLIRSFEVTELAALEASARVITQEDELVVVHLNSQGYRNDSTGLAYETIDDLLSQLSRRYREGQQNSLMRKLEQLARSRDND